MINQAKEIAVVICSYNRAGYIAGAIDSLRLQTLSPAYFEVIVVDNNSTDNTAAVVEQYMQDYPSLPLTFLSETRQGASFARNAGAAYATALFLCFMDDDALAEPDYLETIRHFFANHPEAGGMGGRIIPRYIPAKPAWMSYHVSSLVGNFEYSPVLTAFAPGKYPLESNMVVRKTDFHAIGGFNTALPGVKGTLRIGGEGKDFFLRLQSSGKTIWYHPQAVVHHVVETKKLTREYMYRVASGIGRGEAVRTKTIGKGAFVKKIFEYLYKLVGSVVLGAGYAVKGQPAQFWPVVKYRVDALKGLLGY